MITGRLTRRGGEQPEYIMTQKQSFWGLDVEIEAVEEDEYDEYEE
jgi:hypothetical protein